jgi:predicted cupin superfamily sugar epimerase
MLGDILRTYDWYDHPEGMRFVQTHRDAYRTCGHWLFLSGHISAFHRVLNNEELWLIHEGSVHVHVISSDGEYTLVRLGMDFAAGERPVISIPEGHWQAAEVPEGTAYAFGSNVCAPGFTWDAFELGARDALLDAFPAHRDLVLRLTHAGDLPMKEEYEQNL